MRGRLFVLALSAMVYTVACALPAIEFGGDRHNVEYGIAVLGIGWLGLFVGQFGWLANFAGFAGIVLLALRRWLAAAFFALAGFGIGLTSLFLLGKEVPGDEGGVTKQHVVAYHAGFYVWLASFAVLAIGAIALRVSGVDAARAGEAQSSTRS